MEIDDQTPPGNRRALHCLQIDARSARHAITPRDLASRMPGRRRIFMAKAVTLSNGRTWKTQGVALEHFKQMLARYADEGTVEDRDDHEDLVALLVRYDETITNGPPK